MDKKYIFKDKKEKHDAITRLNRIDGQVNAIKKMIDEERSCEDVLIQLSAVDKAIKGLANSILEQYMHNYITENISSNKDELISEVVTLFKRFQ